MSAPALGAGAQPEAPQLGVQADPATAVGDEFLALARIAGIPVAQCRVSDHGTPDSELWAHEGAARCSREEAPRELFSGWHALGNGQVNEELKAYTNAELRLICFRLGLPHPAAASSAKSEQSKANTKLRKQIVAAVNAALDKPGDGSDSDAGARRKRGRSAGRPPEQAEHAPREVPSAASEGDAASADERHRVPDTPLTPRRAKALAGALDPALREALLNMPDGSRGSAKQNGVYGDAPRASGAKKAAAVLQQHAGDDTDDASRSPPRARGAGKHRAKDSGHFGRREHRTRRRSPSPSSSSDSDDTDSSQSDSDSDHGRSPRHSGARSAGGSLSRRERRQLVDLGFDEPLTDKMLQQMLRRGDTVYAVIARETFKSSRNAHEAQVLARMLDFFREGSFTALWELLGRRLAGVRAADKSGSWEIAESLEGNSQREVDLPASLLGRVVKRATQLQAFHKLGTSGSSRGAAAGAGGSDSQSGSGSSSRRGGQRRGGSGGGRGGYSGNYTGNSGDRSGDGKSSSSKKKPSGGGAAGAGSGRN